MLTLGVSDVFCSKDKKDAKDLLGGLFQKWDFILHSFFESENTWWFKVTVLGWLSDLLERLSDLQLGDEKGTLNHLVGILLLVRVLETFS